MDTLLSILRGGFLKGYRTQIIGITAAVGVILSGLAHWAVGDMSLIDAIQHVDWYALAGFLGMATFAQKVNNRLPK